jgi:hypothetical protein
MKTQRPIIAFVMTLLLSAFIGCSKGGGGGFKEGGLYQYQNANGSYSVLKILKSESGGVHVRLYSNQFDSPQTKIDESKLYIVGREAKPNETIGATEVPWTWDSFSNRKPVFVQQSTVSAEELQGYNEWLKGKHNYF